MVLPWFSLWELGHQVNNETWFSDRDNHLRSGGDSQSGLTSLGNRACPTREEVNQVKLDQIYSPAKLLLLARENRVDAEEP